MRPEESKTPLHDGTRNPSDLDCRYGKIGISAVAAALRCFSEDDAKGAPAAAERPVPQHMD